MAAAVVVVATVAGGLAATASTASAAQSAAAARSDTVTVPLTAGLPWSDPQHATQLEQLAGAIASRIAGRTVTIRCEGTTDWNKLTLERGVDPAAELGYVGVRVRTSGATVVGIDIESFAELSTGTCAALQAFAQADPKPTKCRPPVTTTVAVLRATQVTTRVKVDLGPDPKHPGKRRSTTRLVTKTVQKPVKVTTTEDGPPTPCYSGGLTPGERSPRFAVPPATRAQLADYGATADALQTLAHESLHLGGSAGGTTSTGVPWGDPLAEAKAECGGVQWIAFVAQQLGATPDDALAIAQYHARWLYPGARTAAPLYWSADCVPGGALDVRRDRSAPWPTGLP